MIRIAQDELKSSANEQLVGHRAAAGRGDQRPLRAHLAGAAGPDPQCDRRPKLGRRGEDLAAHLGHRRHPRHRRPAGHGRGRGPAAGRGQGRLRGTSSRPAASTRWRCCACRPALIETFRESGDVYVREVRYIPQTDDWLATVVLPLKTSSRRGASSLSARIDLDPLRQLDRQPSLHPDRACSPSSTCKGTRCSIRSRPTSPITRSWRRRSACWPRRTPLISVEPYARPDGEVMLGAFAFPRPFDWAILVEKRQRDAYLAVEKMLHSLGLWVADRPRRGGRRRDRARAQDQPADPQDRSGRQGGRARQLRGPGRRASARATRSAISPSA